MTDPIKERVIIIIARHIRVDAAMIAPTATLDSLGIASFQGIEITFEIEDSFDINVPIGSCDFTVDTVGEMVEAVRALWRSKHRPLPQPTCTRRSSEVQDEQDRWLYAENMP